MEIVTHSLREIAQRIQFGVASDEEIEQIKLEDIYAIKTDQEAVFIRSVVKAPADAGKRRKRYVANEESVDRMGDIIRQAGWDHRDFKKNPIALWAHNDRGFPIGTVDDIEISSQKTPRLLETIEYLPPEVSEEADQVWRLVDAGVIKGVSVGFRPVKTKIPKNEEERKALGLGPIGVLYEKQAQLELSNCSIPCHQNALATRSLVTKALGELVDAKKISKSEAAELEKIADRLEEGERRVFGGIDIPEPSDEGNPDPEPKLDFDAEIFKRIDALTQCFRSFSVEINALTKRIEQMHAALPVSVEKTEPQEDDPDDFLREVLAHVEKRLTTENGARTNG